MTSPARVHVADAELLDPPLNGQELIALATMARRLPHRWISTPRRRRFFFLALATPGFVAVFSTPLHRSFLLLLLGFAAFAAALVFRRLSEGVFRRAEAAALWPPTLSPKEYPDA